MMEDRQRLVQDGLVAGAIGWLAVALFHLVVNLASGRPAMYTAAVMGEALFAGLRDPGGASMDTGLAIAFNGVQLMALLAFGFFAAWLAYEAERHPQAWYLAMFLYLAGTVAGFAGLLVVITLLGGVAPAWLVLASSLLGATSVAVYFAMSHRPLVRMTVTDT